ncbi:MAG: transcription antitermination factor NusB, partial [Exilibacterium sp.]
MDPRTQAVKVLCRVIQHRASLSSALPALIEPLAAQDRGLLQELSYGTLRYYPQLLAYLKLLLSKPLKAKDSDIQATLLLGLYQILH